jgi:hypothetical protein
MGGVTFSSGNFAPVMGAEDQMGCFELLLATVKGRLAQLNSYKAQPVQIDDRTIGFVTEDGKAGGVRFTCFSSDFDPRKK